MTNEADSTAQDVAVPQMVKDKAGPVFMGQSEADFAAWRDSITPGRRGKAGHGVLVKRGSLGVPESGTPTDSLRPEPALKSPNRSLSMKMKREYSAGDTPPAKQPEGNSGSGSGSYEDTGKVVAEQDTGKEGVSNMWLFRLSRKFVKGLTGIFQTPPKS
mmetsp:Transcript_14413/g.35238  ORF Transcript_14413/g.35238 Transcript_14413/m.35238 type:complete len:159 (-) Transcript_14413:382-858(-)